MITSQEIRVAKWSDEPDISAMMTLAFAADPMVRLLFPNPSNYLTASEKYAGLSSGLAFDHGSAYIIGNTLGAALWLPPGVQVNAKPEVNSKNTNATPIIPDDFRLLREKTHSYRPEEPHWYLSLLAVDPIQQGKGYGAALMSYSLAVCELDKHAVYLESTDAANIAFYKRFGFDLLAEVRVNQFVRYPMLHRSA